MKDKERQWKIRKEIRRPAQTPLKSLTNVLRYELIINSEIKLKFLNLPGQDAVEVLKYLRSQVRTFSRRFARIKNFNKTIGNKLGKKGVFEESAKYLLLSLGM